MYIYGIYKICYSTYLLFLQVLYLSHELIMSCYIVPKGFICGCNVLPMSILFYKADYRDLYPFHIVLVRSIRVTISLPVSQHPTLPLKSYVVQVHL